MHDIGRAPRESPCHHGDIIVPHLALNKYLLCQVFMCIIRLLAEDESRADREHRRIDLALLDAVTWPEFVWEWLRLVGAQCVLLRP